MEKRQNRIVGFEFILILILFIMSCSEDSKKQSSTSDPSATIGNEKASGISILGSESTQIGACMPIQINLIDSNGNLTSTSVDLSFDLSVTGSLAGVFYNNDGCSGTAAVGLSFVTGDSTKYIYFKAPQVGTGNIMASGNLMGTSLSTAKPLQIIHDSFNVNEYTIDANEFEEVYGCYKMTITLKDSIGNTRENTTGSPITVSVVPSVVSSIGTQLAGAGLVRNCSGTMGDIINPEIPILGSSIDVYWKYDPGAIEISISATANIGSNPNWGAWVYP